MRTSVDSVRTSVDSVRECGDGPHVPFPLFLPSFLHFTPRRISIPAHLSPPSPRPPQTWTGGGEDHLHMTSENYLHMTIMYKTKSAISFCLPLVHARKSADIVCGSPLTDWTEK